ncbi:MAG TPA: sigma factor, partial [Polyangiaceae bacterium]|nr:sigma factor [Polyangiaceae bacterium]
MSASTDSDLDELLARLAEGDRSVFSRVFSQLWPPALRLCRSLLGNEADASDAAQEALEKVFSRASDYERG